MSNAELEDFLKHFGVKGMKWGVRKQKDKINRSTRTIKKGTEIQNISSRQYVKNGRHMYGAYTSYDKNAYTDLMGNFMYNERGYKNNFVVKKDIKIPSDKVLVNEFTAMVKRNPKMVARDMSKAYNEVSLLTSKSVKHYEKKLNKISDSDLKRGEKITKDYISILVSNKASKSRAEFFGALIKKGFDGMSDVNDRDQLWGTQDPLIIFNPNKSLGKNTGLKLTKDDLNKYAKITEEKNHKRMGKNLSEIQR